MQSNQSFTTVAALFVEHDSVYKRLPGVDAWDAERDALTWLGGQPGVYHPPCRLWGQLSHFSKAPKEERELALWSIDSCRSWGGVVEHPLHSKLWDRVGCLGLGMRDRFGGVLIPVLQAWYGHRAPKATALYIVGVVPGLKSSGTSVTTVERMSRRERLATPEPFARFLVSIARGSLKPSF